MAIAFVTGATGCLGQALCADLIRRGWDLRSLSRGTTPPEATGARHYALDLSRDDLPADMLAGVDAVFHCAALSSAWGARAAFHAANVAATERLLAAARAAGVGRFVFASTPSIYINGRPRLDLAEDAPLPHRFLTDYARTKFIAEALVRRANGPGFTTVALRPRAIYGPHDRALLPRLLAALKDGRPLPLPGGGAALIDPTHASDAARAMRLAAMAGAGVAGGRAYNITSGQALSVDALLDELEKLLGRAIPRRPVPYAVAAAAADLAERLQRLHDPAQEPRLTRHAVAALGLSLTLDISAARRDLGYVPRVALAEGLAALRPIRPAEAACPGIRLRLLRVGECTAPGRSMRRDAPILPRRVPALVAVLGEGAAARLFDTGYGRGFGADTRWLPEFGWRLVVPSRLPPHQQLDRALRRLGVDRVVQVILSHLHADHVSGLFDLPETPHCLVSDRALAHLAGLARGGRVTALFEALPMPLVRRLQGLADSGRLTGIGAARQVPLPPGLTALGPGRDLAGDGSIVAVPLPGHGRGQVGLWLPQSSRGPVLLAADAAFSAAALRDGVLPPDAVLSRLGDAPAYRRTFATLARFAAEGAGVIVSHDPDVATD